MFEQAVSVHTDLPSERNANVCSESPLLVTLSSNIHPSIPLGCISNDRTNKALQRLSTRTSVVEVVAVVLPLP